MQTGNRNDPASGKFRRIVSQEPAAHLGQDLNTDQGRNNPRRQPRPGTYFNKKNIGLEMASPKGPPLPAN